MLAHSDDLGLSQFTGMVFRPVLLFCNVLVSAIDGTGKEFLIA